MQISRSLPHRVLLVAALIGLTSGQQQAPAQPQQVTPIADTKAQILPLTSQQIVPTNSAQLQAQFSQLQQQAQRQFGQLNGLVLNAVNSSKYSNVLEAISNVGKAIHQQISQATNPNHVNIVTNSGSPNESANSKKNEYQSIVVTDQGSSLQPPNNLTALTSANYREQGELLRQEIVRRAGQLQQVVAGSMDLLKNNGDLIVRRLLEQMNVRLDQAKAKADKIINEPTTNEVALRALGTINLGLNNLNNIIANIVNRLDQANREAQLQQQNQLAGVAAGQQQQQATGNIQQRQLTMAQLPQIIDANKFKTNLHQLSQQFQQALNGSALHQQLALIRAQRLQQQQQQPPPPQQMQLNPTAVQQSAQQSVQKQQLGGKANK